MDNTLPPLKRIAAIHDLSGLGKCSLTVALPVISATGVECACIPTAVLSTHTGEFTGWTFRDLSDDMLPIAHHWQRIGARIDGVYSGYLASPGQAQLLAQTLDCIAAPDTLVVIDPVMADNGKVYPTYTPELCDAMAELAAGADILTPNLTEAAIILGEPIGDDWCGTDISDAEAARMIDALVAKGAKHVVLKGIQREGESVIRNFVGGVDCDMFEAANEYLPYMLHGTGDLYCSCLMAAVMAGRSLRDAVVFAGDFTHDAMIVSAKQPDFKNRGVSFEPLLGKVAQLLG